MKTLKIGVVGAGAIAQRNAREAVNSQMAEIVGIYDVNQKAAGDMARALSSRVFPSYEELLEKSGAEAVLLSTPHHLHRPQAMKAAERGKHILVEKPMANNLVEASDIIRECKRNGVSLTVNYSFRYLSKIRRAKKLIDGGALGEITGVQILSHQFKDPGYWSGARSNSPDDWRCLREKSGGGYLIMNVCHAIDYIYYLTGLKALRVYSEYANQSSPGDVEDVVSVTCRFNNGAIGTISASSILRGMEQGEEIIWGTNGTVVLNTEGLSFYSTRPIEGMRPGKMHKVKNLPEVNWTAEWVKGFVVAVREGRDPEVTFREGWENLAFITSAYESLEHNKPTMVPHYENGNRNERTGS
jgi:predicted dehydrogenase